MIASIFIAILLIFLSGIFSGSEAALFSLDRGKLSRLIEKNPKKARILQFLLQKPDKILSVILLGNLAVNISFTYIGDSIFQSNVAESENLQITSMLTITFCLLVFGEIFPKIAAIQWAEKWSVLFSPLIYFWYRTSLFLAWPISLLTEFITSNIKSTDNKIKEKDMIYSVRDAQNQGILNQDEQWMLQRCVNFYHDTAYSIMVPKSQVFRLPLHSTLKTAKAGFLENESSISLIYNERTNEFTGYLNARSIVPHLNRQNSLIKKYIQPLQFYPETILLVDLLEEFLKEKSEVAAILSELGEFSGIVTMKDIFQSLMGEMEGKATTIKGVALKPDITKKSENKYTISGALTLHEFNEYFGTNLESVTSETLSGYLIEKLDGFPRRNTVIIIDNMKFEKMKVVNYQIKTSRITIL